jgi:hypothetical protein
VGLREVTNKYKKLKKDSYEWDFTSDNWELNETINQMDNLIEYFIPEDTKEKLGISTWLDID